MRVWTSAFGIVSDDDTVFEHSVGWITDVYVPGVGVCACVCVWSSSSGRF